MVRGVTVNDGCPYWRAKKESSFNIFSIKVTVAGNILVVLLSQEYKHVKKFDSIVKSSNL